MTRRTNSASTRRSRMATPQQRPNTRRAARGSQIVILVAAGFIGAVLLFVITGAAASRITDRKVIIESSQANVTPNAVSAPDAMMTPTLRATVARPSGPYVGIVAGHWGNDSGAVCPNGMTEQQVNLEIAKRVTERLRERGVWVDLLQEFDDRLNGFRADVLVSIHADSCDPIDADPPATGFKVARSQASQIPTVADKLVECLRTEYQKTTGLSFHENSITNDMTSYHSFNELDPNTPAAIIETGFLHLDYDMIVKQPELPAEGITNGILCFLKTQL